MDRKLNQSGEFDKPTWDWTPVQCVLKTTQYNRKSVQWQLAPSILLTNPTSTNSDPNVRLFIDTEKSLSYAPDLGWNWHKSWNLPNISIRLEIKDQITGQQLLTPKNIYAQIFAVKKNGDNQRSEKVTLLDVGIRGESKMEMVDGQVYFSAMKFSSTTYNNEGQNFHLLIVIYIQQNETEKPKVLTAVISPQIFVDSRRSARDYQQKKFNSFVEPFSTDQLQKQFIKRENKSRTEQQIEIKNDPQGFYNYLTAPNIRHKVKHPIFLAIRFSNCVTILYNHQKLTQLYNTQRDPQPLTARDVIQMIQRKLLKQSQTKSVRQQTVVSSIPEKLFLFIVKNVSDSLKRKKVMESIQTLQSQSFGVVQDEKQIPPQFKKFTDFGSLSKIYKDNFELLKELCRRYVPSDEESSNQESDDEYGKQQQVKKVKVNKLQNGNGFTFANTPANNRRSKTANIVCQTIQTVDNKPAAGSSAKNAGDQANVNDKKSPIEQSSNNKAAQKQKQKQIKKQQQYPKQANYPTHDNVGFHPLSNNLNLNSNNPNPMSSFSMNIGSKKGSAFNNLRTPQPEKNQPFNQQFNSAMGYSGFTANTNNPYGMTGIGGMSGMNAFSVAGMNQGASGMPGMSSMPNLNNMSGLNPMSGLTGMANFSGMTGLSGLSNMTGLNGMSGMPGMSGMSGMNNMGGLTGVSGMNNMTGIPGMSGLGGMGMGNMNLPGFQGMNSNSLTGLLGNTNSFSNFNNNPQGNLNTQAKSLQNLLCSNLLLSNWLNSVKANNMNLYETMKGTKLDDEQMKPTDTKNIQDSLNEVSRMSPQLQQQQSMYCLLQQINLYRQLLAQVSYQNSLLGRNINPSQGMGSNPNMNDLQEMLQSNNQALGGIGGLSSFRGFQQGKQSQSREPKQEHQQ